jgi:hypothetical protein
LTPLVWKCGKRSNLLNTTGSSQKNPPGFGLDEGSSKNLLSNHLKFLAVAKPLKMILPSNIAPAVGAVSSPSSALGGLLIFWGGAGDGLKPPVSQLPAIGSRGPQKAMSRATAIAPRFFVDVTRLRF